MIIFLSDGPHLTSAKRMSDHSVFGVEVMPEKLEPVTNFVISQFSDEKTAIIVNDMSNSSKQHNNFGMLSYLAYSGRHRGISLYLLSQKLSSVATGVRDNAMRIIFFPTHCKRSLKTVGDKFFGHLSIIENKT
jgi:hypothetical protein